MLRLPPGSIGRLDALDDGVGSAAGGEVAGFGVLVGLQLPPGVMQRGKEALGVAHLDLTAAEGDGKLLASLSKPGWSSPVPMIEEVCAARRLQCSGPATVTRSAGKPVWRLKWPISVTKVSISCSVGVRRKHHGGLAQVGKRVNGKPALAKISRLGSGA